MSRRNAFTLVELLVVVTIIVVLLALLTPALDQAIYQADLAVCGSIHRAAGTGLLAYTVNYKRHYPHRIIQSRGGPVQPHYISEGPKRGPGDDRPVLGLAIQVSKMLQCPLLARQVDLENQTGQSTVQGSCLLWVGWQYPGETGMKRMGDRFSWTDTSGPTPVTHRFNVLTSPYNILATGTYSESHFDRDGLLSPVVEQNATPLVGTVPGDIAIARTTSFWAGSTRGPLDENFGYDDGSVRRLDNVEMMDDRLVPIPLGEDASAYPTLATWMLEQQ